MKKGKIDTSYLSRCIYKIHQENASGETVFTGTYKLMLRAKSIPSPTSAPNAIEITDFEDSSQTFTLGIKQSDSKEFTGNLDRVYFDPLLEDEGKVVDILQLYGRDGVGGLAKSAYTGQFAPTVNDLSGTDAVIEMTCTVVQNTSPVWVTDDFDVIDNGDGTFTVTANGSDADVTLNRSNITMTVGDVFKLNATTKPIGATVTFTSSAGTKASVDNTGTVRALDAGEATITASITVDGETYTDTCTVTVEAGV